jgi:ParB-like chromosome segregation protein Spo0J
MTKPVKMAFNPEGVKIPLDSILPLKKVKSSVKKTMKYRQIATSIREVGVIEHLIVYPQNGSSGNYLLLDGHLRFEVLKEIGQKEVFCLVSTDDEAFTYNHKVNRISPIQEHFMILRAIEKGVSEERIANTLNVDIAKIRQKRNLLENICSEVVELLKDKHFSPNAIRILKKMKPMRQIEVVELMIAANNYTVPYAQALLAATPKDQLIEQRKPKRIEGLSPEEMARMEKETEILARDFKVVKDSYGKDTLNLVLACGYLS